MTSLPSYPTSQLQQNNPLGSGAESGTDQGPMERMRSTLDQAKRRLPELQDRARHELYRADDYVRLHPYQVIGLAAAIGAVVGIFLARRHW
jgi:ElaB/YqjD/DUF883 family membrane-anchored ribosome-binding protein